MIRWLLGAFWLVVLSIGLNMAASELFGYGTRAGLWFIRRWVRLLPHDQRDRWQEEWEADVIEKAKGSDPDKTGWQPSPDRHGLGLLDPTGGSPAKPTSTPLDTQRQSGEPCWLVHLWAGLRAGLWAGWRAVLRAGRVGLRAGLRAGR